MGLDEIKLEVKRAKWAAYMRKYREKPGVMEKVKAYYHRPEVKARRQAYHDSPEVRKRRQAYQKVYCQKPEVKARKRATSLALYYKKKALKKSSVTTAEDS